MRRSALCSRFRSSQVRLLALRTVPAAAPAAGACNGRALLFPNSLPPLLPSLAAVLTSEEMEEVRAQLGTEAATVRSANAPAAAPEAAGSPFAAPTGPVDPSTSFGFLGDLNGAPAGAEAPTLAAALAPAPGAVLRGRRLLQDLLAASGEATADPSPLEVEGAVDPLDLSAPSLTLEAAGEGGALRTTVGSELPVPRVDPGVHAAACCGCMQRCHAGSCMLRTLACCVKVVQRPVSGMRAALLVPMQACCPPRPMCWAPSRQASWRRGGPSGGPRCPQPVPQLAAQPLVTTVSKDAVHSDSQVPRHEAPPPPNLPPPPPHTHTLPCHAG
jgi:hypothetical protein